MTASGGYNVSRFVLGPSRTARACLGKDFETKNSLQRVEFQVEYSCTFLDSLEDIAPRRGHCWWLKRLWQCKKNQTRNDKKCEEEWRSSPSLQVISETDLGVGNYCLFMNECLTIISHQSTQSQPTSHTSLRISQTFPLLRWYSFSQENLSGSFNASKYWNH